MTMSARMDYMTVTQMQTVQTRMEVFSVLAMMDFLETGKVALVNEHAPVFVHNVNKHRFVFVLFR